ncbi:MAG TPA: fumarylacetoacetate hydrolase family protein [Rhodanobacteraceae bacterium]
MSQQPSQRGRVAYAGAIHEAYPTEEDGQIRLEDGRICGEGDVVWLAPFELGSIFALGLNYADHAKEIAVAAHKEPLIFLKGPQSVVGHRGTTRRPDGVKLMHYECELAVVIGRLARNVARAEALDYVAGYTIANDYTVRDYLENYYRPNLRVKSRDGGTALGPWLTDAAAVPDPGHLEIRTYVNGAQTQQGSTADMVTPVPELIEYLSSFATLAPGDVILTGTPKGVVNVAAGDEVVCEIGHLGRLANFILADTAFHRAAAQEAT